MTIPTREPFLAYLQDHATILRQRRATAPAAAVHLEAHAHALELLPSWCIPVDSEEPPVLNDFAGRCPNGDQFATAMPDIPLASWRRLTEQPHA